MHVHRLADCIFFDIITSCLSLFVVVLLLLSLLKLGFNGGEHGVRGAGQGEVPRGSAGVHAPPRLREHGDAGPVAGLDGGIGHRRGLAHAHLDHAHGLPLPQGDQQQGIN